MTCRSCLEKAYDKYRKYGFSHDDAVFMAKKLMKRVEKRRRKERIRFFYRNINRFLWKWTFICNWKASLFNHRWIGRSYNPDYTQACVGVCAVNFCDNFMGPCVNYLDCQQVATNCAAGTCDCVAPLPNSSKVSNGCTCNASGQKCLTCSGSLCRVLSYNCPCSGTCGYNCDPGYVWNGVSCVAVGGVLIQLPKMGVGL